MTVYHTPITVETVAKNGSERFGAHAKCTYWQQYEGMEPMKITYEQYGKTKKEAVQKAKEFLGKNAIEIKILNLTLKKKWFDMIASGEKKEEYREIKPYWVKRLTDTHKGAMGGDLMDRHKVESYTIKRFTHVVFKHGYAKDAPTMKIEIADITIGDAVPEWSDNWQGKVFVIKLGNIIKATCNA